MRLCNILKLSDEELPVLTDLFSIEGTVEERLGILIEKCELKLIACMQDGATPMLPAAILEQDVWARKGTDFVIFQKWR